MSVSQSLVQYFVPVAPDSVGISLAYVGATEYLTFIPAYVASDPTLSIQAFQWQSSTDGGSTWSVTASGPVFQKSLASGTLMARCRAVNPQWPTVGVSAWVNSANTTFAPSPTRTVTTQTNTAYTIKATDSIVLVSTGAVNRVMTMPSAGTAGLLLTVKKIDAGAGTVVLTAAGSDTFEGGGTTLTIAATQFKSYTVFSDGGSPGVWYIQGST